VILPILAVAVKVDGFCPFDAPTKSDTFAGIDAGAICIELDFEFRHAQVFPMNIEVPTMRICSGIW
jgi:hypothetical protein